MNINEPLTKEKFWNEMMDKFPNATKAFCDWVDEYKKATKWNELFGDSVKYHHLPHAMQMGIWLEYLCQRGGCQWQIDNFFEFDLRTDIAEMFEKLLEEEANESLNS